MARRSKILSCVCLLVAMVLCSGRSAAADAPRLRAIRCLGGREYSRLVLDLTGSVEYRLQQRAPATGVPTRVSIDLLGARVAPASPAPACPAGGPLAQLQVAQTDRGVRLVLAVPGLTAARAFPLLDPFRLVVDVEAVTARPLAVATPAAPARGATLPSRSERLKIVIDPGHGGKDPGARGVGGIRESDVVLAIALELREQLQALPGVDVVLTRARDVFLSLEERTARANAEHADLFVSIHANASPNHATSGVETYYLSNTNDRATLRLAAMENGVAARAGGRRRDRDAALLISALIQNYKLAESAALAESVQQGVVSAATLRAPRIVDLGVKQGPFYVLVGAGMPCVLAEVSFLTHPEEGARLAQPVYRSAIAQGLLRGIRHFVDNRRLAGTL